MSKAWVWDMNYNILGENVHWTTNPPKPVDGSLDYWWHTYLAHNLLTNLFHGMDFNWYYTSPIRTVVSHFIVAFDTVPTSESDTFRLASFMPQDIAIAQHLLDRIASHPLATRPLKDLYLQPYDKELDPIVDLFEIMQLSLRWICIPFVGLRQDIRLGLLDETDRPTEKDLQEHLFGTGDFISIGVANMSYEDFLKGDNGDANFEQCRNLAFFLRFFDDNSPAERARGLQLSSVGEGAASRLELIEMPRDRHPLGVVTASLGTDGRSVGVEERRRMMPRPLGGGNGYKCSIEAEPPGSSNYVRRCKVAAPTDYCVNNGTNFCP